MSGVERTLRALIIISATVFVTEWIHYSLGEPTVLRLVRPETAEDDAGAAADAAAASVTESEFQSYLQVLEAMQADHALPIEKAVAAAHQTISHFRDIEQRVQRNDVLVERTREMLRKKAQSLFDSRRAAVGHG